MSLLMAFETEASIDVFLSLVISELVFGDVRMGRVFGGGGRGGTI